MIQKRINKYCNDDITKIENYEQAINDTTQTWHCHHRLETDLNLSQQELKDRGLYYNRPASELIFLTSLEHGRLHYKGKHLSEETIRKRSALLKGKHRSEETRRKMSEAKKGKTSNNKGKHLSEETIRKKSALLKGKHRSEETKRKMSEARKGRIFINNGQIAKMIYPNELDYYISLGYTKGRLKRK